MGLRQRRPDHGLEHCRGTL